MGGVAESLRIILVVAGRGLRGRRDGGEACAGFAAPLAIFELAHDRAALAKVAFRLTPIGSQSRFRILRSRQGWALEAVNRVLTDHDFISSPSIASAITLFESAIFKVEGIPD